jgi:hypothetical protein
MVLEAEETEVGRDPARIFFNDNVGIKYVELESSASLRIEAACSGLVWYN